MNSMQHIEASSSVEIPEAEVFPFISIPVIINHRHSAVNHQVLFFQLDCPSIYIFAYICLVLDNQLFELKNRFSVLPKYGFATITTSILIFLF
ncbi:hypothetical protein RO3G_15235 [Rhizopus delemar RA 99-880]|uniref:Uncharacterized protein n=1 Tax=Rhizopus delemar (strain RA 99-880 / ATCC MYA-4621 / FGSC 9543 / NRRL 43880) TaxID=246409 RepID=I1CPZ4_RHIO9|nr:hypothetical protein RO3G_15235 [Rhizopus delemar RA 99-880]|eukprot:EIE90524.1 hypothetical protein RO3G_15235 [Rhizopus delemar RA 99-880]